MSAYMRAATALRPPIEEPSTRCLMAVIFRFIFGQTSQRALSAQASRTLDWAAGADCALVTNVISKTNAGLAILCA